MLKYILYFFISSGAILSQQAWAPYERQLWLRPIITHSEYNSAYLANSFAKFDDNIRVTTGSIALEYGITDRLTIDGNFGFGRLGGYLPYPYGLVVLRWEIMTELLRLSGMVQAEER